MRFRDLVGIILLSGCMLADAQPPPDWSYRYKTLNDDEDAAFAASREPYRGYHPFAIARYSPFGADAFDAEWFSLSFFTYWTGYDDTGDAKQHWLVRRIGGARAYWDDRGREVAATPGGVNWATSESCPALTRAVARFEVHERIGFVDGSRAGNAPGPRQNVVTIAVYDASWFDFWARLDHRANSLEISMSGPANDSDVAEWVFESLAEMNSCFSEAAPVIPDAGPDRGMPSEPLDIFADIDEALARADHPR